MRTEKVIYKQNGLFGIFPEGALKHFPLSLESFSRWNNGTDVLQFLYKLYDQSTIMVGPDGKRRRINYRSYGLYIYKRGQEKVKIIIKEMVDKAKSANPAPGAAKQKIVIPSFSKDLEFGKAAKYMIAWDGVVSALLSESAFFSIAHILEADADINCSFHLLMNLYYKQAMQILRNYLEGLVMTVYFCDNQNAYLAWKADSYQSKLRLRGSGGILEKLFNKKILPRQIVDEISRLYGDMNNYVHGGEKYLINRGIYTGDWMGYVFKVKDFRICCKYISRSIDVGVRVLRINTIQWLNSHRDYKILCDVCHNHKDFKTEEYYFAGEKHIRYHCLRCGNEMTLTAK